MNPTMIRHAVHGNKVASVTTYVDNLKRFTSLFQVSTIRADGKLCLETSSEWSDANAVMPFEEWCEANSVSPVEPEAPEEHVCVEDNQGFCHNRCGRILNAASAAAYLGKGCFDTVVKMLNDTVDLLEESQREFSIADSALDFWVDTARSLGFEE